MTAYEKPQLMPMGSLETLTQGHTNGGKLDASFPTSTPKGELTFS